MTLFWAYMCFSSIFCCVPKIYFDKCIMEIDTPLKMELKIKNDTRYSLSFGREYQIDAFVDGDWIDIKACSDFKSDKITLEPLEVSKSVVFIPKLKHGLYRIWKNIEYNNKTHFVAYEFYVE